MDEYLSDFAKKFHLTTNETESRNYPLGKATSHLLGYVGPINSEELKQKNIKAIKMMQLLVKRDSKNFTIKSSNMKMAIVSQSLTIIAIQSHIH